MTLEEIRRSWDRRLTAGEFEAYVRAPMSDREREEILSLADWFTRRYPTPAERLAYLRRAHARWVRPRGRPDHEPR
jgi:hypothetical protein